LSQAGYGPDARENAKRVSSTKCSKGKVDKGKNTNRGPQPTKYLEIICKYIFPSIANILGWENLALKQCVDNVTNFYKSKFIIRISASKIT